MPWRTIVTRSCPNRRRFTLCEHFKTKSLDGFGCAEMPAAVGAGGRDRSLSQTSVASENRSSFVVALRSGERLRGARCGDADKSRVWSNRAARATRVCSRRSIARLRQWAGENCALGFCSRCVICIELELPPADDRGSVAGIRFAAVAAQCAQIDPRYRARGRPAVARLGKRARSGRVEEFAAADPRAKARARKQLIDRSAGQFRQRQAYQPQHCPGQPARLTRTFRHRANVAKRDRRRCRNWPRNCKAQWWTMPPLALKEGGIFRDGFDAQLDELRQASREGKNWITALQEREIAATGIKSLKVRFNSVFGYFIEITKSNLANVPAHYTRKQTTVGGERFITPELKEMEAKILGADERARQSGVSAFPETCARKRCETWRHCNKPPARSRLSMRSARLAETARLFQLLPAEA